MHKFNQPGSGELPIELRLLAACCDHPVNTATSRKVARLAGDVRDWGRLWAIARRHQIQGFVQDRLSRYDGLPAEWRQRWAQEARARAPFNLRQAQLTGELHKLLNENAIPNLVIKGLPLAAEVYGSLVIKRSSDIDLLVSPEHAPRAAELLARHGFVTVATGQPMSPNQTASVVRQFKEITLHNDSGIVIDLHWRLVATREMLSGIECFANARQVSIENIGKIAVLGEQDQFAYLCAHGALSDWSRFKWLADVNAVIGNRPDDELVQLYNHADRLGAGPSVLQALGLRSLFWDKAMPRILQQKLDELGEPRLLSYPVSRMIDPYRPATSRETMTRIAGETRVRGVLYGSQMVAARELGTHLRPLPDVMAFPLPAALAWLYLPLRPLLWLFRKLRA